MVRDTRGRPLRDLRVSVTDSCNFRCTYCMPRELFGEPEDFLPREEHLSFSEIETVAQAAAKLGARKVKITGGEPLLRPLLPDLVSRLVSIPGVDDVGLITNGYHFAGLARPLRKAGLARVTISLDSLVQETFDRISGRGGSLQRVLDAIELAYDLGYRPLKVNMVVQRGVNDGEILAFAERFRRSGIELRFIEYMDTGHRIDYEAGLTVPSAEILSRISQVYDLRPAAAAYRGEVARRYRHADGEGQIGFISSMTEPFCGSCNRLRLSADGHVFTCLFAREGVDIRTVLRSRGDEGVRAVLERIWHRREDNYSERRLESGLATLDEKRPEMYQIGG